MISKVFNFYNAIHAYKLTKYDDPAIPHYLVIYIRLSENDSDKEAIIYLTVDFMERPLKLIVDSGCGDIHIIVDILSDEKKKEIQKERTVKIRNLGKDVGSVGALDGYFLIYQYRIKTPFHVFEKDGLDLDADGLVGWELFRKLKGKFVNHFSHLRLTIPTPKG